MRKILSIFVFFVAAAAVFAQNVSAPTNLTVTAMRTDAGQQYFHLTFMPGATDSGDYAF